NNNQHPFMKRLCCFLQPRIGYSNVRNAVVSYLDDLYLIFMACKSIYDFSAETLDGQLVPLSNYRGKVLLIINVATF
uniref:Glutathione peroxidase n=1 Tax=Sparus aurata TaxID=8175 RepID=A0A671XYY6_SPAAU